jgi:Glycosyl transferase family 11
MFLSNEKRVICRIKGGLGNQLFCYAAARRLAIYNQSTLILDDVSGFIRDHQDQRKYSLNHFHIPVRKASPGERLEPFERYRRGIMKWASSKQKFSEKYYLEQEDLDFDGRLLNLKLKGTLYLDGYWQSEQYFKDIEQIIREDLRIIPPQDSKNQRIAQTIQQCHSVALHVRWFDDLNDAQTDNISLRYYQTAISLVEQKVYCPHYFLFSNDPELAKQRLSLPEDRVTCMNHNQGDGNAYADLWLMSQCQSFITANSTFSWWGAWLSRYPQKLVITPGLKMGRTTAWGFDGLIPDTWIKV